MGDPSGLSRVKGESQQGKKARKEGKEFLSDRDERAELKSPLPRGSAVEFHRSRCNINQIVLVTPISIWCLTPRVC